MESSAKTTSDARNNDVKEIIRKSLRIRGIVQGVGFRPHVYRLAKKHALTGWVINNSQGVQIEIQGKNCVQFEESLRTSPPPLAKIDRFESTEMQIVPDECDFTIRHTDNEGTATTLISPDIGICANCRNELSSANDRRYAHPFINCTDCGPRYTIIKKLPYDRETTTMAEFDMCDACASQYQAPDDRRFHAQPICCPDCGPRLKWFEANSAVPDRHTDAQLIDRAADLLASGNILAVKGLGGYHLACDATNDRAVTRLRQRKHREEKPLAIMFRDMAELENTVAINNDERTLLLSAESPIVLCKKQPNNKIAPSVAPGNGRFGVFLPYTPLHHLLLAHSKTPSALVMTSGNITDEPIAFEDKDALVRLGNIADAIIYHNRPIHIRTDDSVVRCIDGRAQFARRSRGYVPMPITLPTISNKTIFAGGADLKNAICITRDGKAFLSHHIGDLENESALNSFIQAHSHLSDILEVTPDVAVCDMHPEYFSSRFIREKSGLPFEEVQHHHAHAAALLAEHGLEGPALIWVCDGTGYGPDETIWGCELLLADLKGYIRIASLRPGRLPGGDLAVQNPWRQVIARLTEFAQDERATILSKKIGIIPNLANESEVRLIISQIKSETASPLSSGLGRLFDSVAAMLGIVSSNAFEGQAPMALEDAAAASTKIIELNQITKVTDPDVLFEDHSESLRKIWHSGHDISPTRLDPRPMLESILESRLNNFNPNDIAMAFHQNIGTALADLMKTYAKALGLQTVGLSGGCFLNEILTDCMKTELRNGDLNMLTHHLVPPGDGCIALGQAACAHSRLEEN